MSDGDQKESIEQFRNGQANIMIATDIAQEGLGNITELINENLVFYLSKFTIRLNILC